MVAPKRTWLLPYYLSEERARLSPDCTPLENYCASHSDSRANLMSGDTLEYSAVRQQDEAHAERHKTSSMVDVSSQEPLQKTRKQRLVRFGWWWEVCAIVIAIASTAAMVAVLLSADGKLLSAWPLSIQPASLVAIFSTITKSALLVPIAVCFSQPK